MNKKNIRACIIIACCLPACSLIPDYKRPDAPVASQYPPYAAQTSSIMADANLETGWETLFADTRLRRLIELGLQNNRDLRETALNIEAARAQYGIQRAALFPSVNATAEATRARSVNIYGGGGVLPPYSIYSVNLGFTAYELDFFGRIRSLKEQALEQFFATQEAQSSARIALIAEIANTYLNVRALEDKLEIARQTQVSQEGSYDLAKRIFEFGNSSEIDLRVAETQLETANANHAGLRRQLVQAENALKLLVGTEMPSDLPKPAPLDAQLTVQELPAGLPSDLLTRRPDIRQAEHLLIAANANIGAARAAFFPAIKLTATLGRASSDLDGLFKSGSSVWSFAPQLTLPIFDAGRNRANLNLAEVQKNIYIARYEKAIQTAFREVADALAGTTILHDQIAAQQRLVEAEQARYKLAELRYRNGIDSNISLLDAQRSLYAAQQTLVDLRQAQLTSTVTLYKALGGGPDGQEPDQ